MPLHAIHQMTDQFFVPLQNQLFIAAFGGGLFAHRTVATVQPCLDSNNVTRTCFQTEVGGVDFGPQLEMLVNPGEAYPAMIGATPSGSSRCHVRLGQSPRCRTARPRDPQAADGAR